MRYNILLYVLILELQENISTEEVSSFAGRLVVDVGEWGVDILLEVPNEEYNIVSNTLYCLWASFITWNPNIQGNLQKTDFLTSWLSDQSAYRLIFSVHSSSKGMIPNQVPIKFRLVAKPGCKEIGFRQISLKMQILYHKWSS